MKATTKLKQLNYIFDSSIEKDVLLFINGHKTTIKIENLFTKISKRKENTIKGWSLIENFEELREYLSNENITIEFKNEANESLKFDVEQPFWQLNDKEIETEDYEVFIGKIKELNLEISKENNTDRNEPGYALPGFVINNNEKFEKLSSRLEKEGFQKFRTDNYVLFLYKDDETENTIVEVTESGYILLNIENQKENEFNVSDNDEVKTTLKLEGDTLVQFKANEISEPVETKITEVKDIDELLEM